MAIHLQKLGIGDFELVERADRVGGTWRDNIYPGVACDVESHLYSLTDYPNPDWSRVWSPGAEIQDYLERAAQHFAIRAKTRFNTHVLACRWDNTHQWWEVETSQGTLTAGVVVSARGPLSEPKHPSFPGLDTFAGQILYTAKWDPSFDASGKTLAVVGTGASAAQLIPAVQPHVQKLLVFQRSAAWVMPNHNRRFSQLEKFLFRRVPLLHRAHRKLLYWFRELVGLGFRRPVFHKPGEFIARWHLARQIRDRQLRKKLTPNYRMGCKRVIVSSQYYPAFTATNVDLITEAVQSFTRDGLQTQSGQFYRADAVVLATGFDLSNFHGAATTFGRSGKSLATVWNGSPGAYLGTMVNDFPNFFFVIGPGTGLGHSSALLMAEAQTRLIGQAIEHLRSHGLRSLEPRAEVQDRYLQTLAGAMKNTVWNSGCASWYKDATGKVSALWPGSVPAFEKALSKFSPADYLVRRDT